MKKLGLLEKKGLSFGEGKKNNRGLSMIERSFERDFLERSKIRRAFGLWRCREHMGVWAKRRKLGNRK